MVITKEWLIQFGACPEGIEWFCRQKEDSPIQLLNLLIKEKRNDWINWGIIRILNKKNKIKYSLYAAEQTLPIFEKKYPENNDPRQTIEAVKMYLKNPTEENKENCKKNHFNIDTIDYKIIDKIIIDILYDFKNEIKRDELLLKIIKNGIKLLKEEKIDKEEKGYCS